MNKDELFETLQAEEESTDFIRINPDSRQANVLESQMILGVRTDKNTERKHFIISRIVGDNVDLTKYTLYILWENAGGTLGRYIVNDVKVSGNDITFSWLIDNTVTVYVGKIHFTLCATKVDSAGKLTNEWNTTLATGTVLEGLEVDYPVIEKPEKDTIAQLLQIVKQTSADAVKDVTAEGEKQVKRVQDAGGVPPELLEQVEQNKSDITLLKTEAYTYKGILDNGTNLDNIETNSCFLIDSIKEYINSPITSGLFFNFKLSGKAQSQIAISYDGDTIFYRRKIVSSQLWEKWKRITVLDKYKTDSKLYCFGDSTVWGAVWGATQGKPLYQAEEKYRIPTRIALATGCINSYVNNGVSGAGYVANGGKITKDILATDLKDASLIFIMGGANDKAHVSLGTSQSLSNDGTVCGAIKQIVEYVKRTASQATLVICQPLPSGTVEMMDDVWSGKYGVSEKFWSLNDFDKEVSKLCYDNHVAYVNWWECPYCDAWKRHSGGYNNSTQNYSHPNEQRGYGILGDFIAGKVANFCNKPNL